MIATAPRFRLLRGAIAASLGLVLVVGAGAVDRPSALVAQDPPSSPGAVQDGRVAVNRVAAVPDGDADRDVILLEVKGGPSYFINRQPVPVPELRSFLASLYAPRPRKVLFVRADAGVPEGELAAAIEAARAGMGAALDEAKRYGGPAESATVNVVASPAR